MTRKEIIRYCTIREKHNNDKVNSNTILLDIGTGGGEKLLNLISNDCLLKIGTDFSNEMVKCANKQNIKVMFVFLKWIQKI